MPQSIHSLHYRDPHPPRLSSPTRRSSDLVVTETIVTTTTTTITEEKYKVVAPEVMHESFMSDSEDEGGRCTGWSPFTRSEEHTSELQSRGHLVCRLLLEKKKKQTLV